MRKIKAILKFIAFIMLCLAMVPTQYLLLRVHKGKNAYILPWFWQKCVCFIFGITIRIIGTPCTASQTLYMSNHTSYLDISVLGSLLRASFVAKKDVASWPVFGFLSKLQQTAFISRDRADALKGKLALDTMLNDGKSLIIFPEGTSTDGRTVLPFKSSLFSIAMKEHLKNISIQPITLKIEKVDTRTVVTQDDRDLYAWHINMDTELGAHLWRFAQSRGAEISLTFHPPVKAHDFSDRKTLAKTCYNTVSNSLETP